ncbi:uncharacterized protein [Prorops nasuta]|uniref:uncharacterized protein n=1 Tax=Prorops nasuta TaxID=863751 RepID=UPI0034CE4C3B
MTVMLLQRSITSQSTTHSQKTARKNCGAKKLPLVFLLDDDRPEDQYSSNNNLTNTVTSSNSGSTTTTTTTTTITTVTTKNNNNNYGINNNNNNNNSINNNNNNNNIVKRIARRSSNRDYICGRGGSGGGGGGSGGGGCGCGGCGAGSGRVVRNDGAGGQGVAMRYYRLWIYACNVVLLGSAIGFAAAVSRTLLFSGDPRRHVVPGVPRAFDPTALYAYLALATQLGLVQLLGCIAARRLNARLLNAYWILLLALLFGDAVIGIAWVFRFERMRAELRPTLKLRLEMEYEKEARFSEQWDRLQKEFKCCGITGPRDFGSRWPPSCCDGDSVNVNGSDTCQQQIYTRGCEEFLMGWLRKTADLLFVLGFCVIAFAKLCFLGILRYEIREMIQKIKLLREPPPPPTTFQHTPFSQITQDLPNNSGGGIVRRTTLPSAVLPSVAGNAPLLLQSDDCNTTGRLPLLTSSLQDPGADSDTNSHCALILEETTPTSMSHNCSLREKSNGNNNYEMQEFNRRLLLSNGCSPGTGLSSVGQNRRT